MTLWLAAALAFAPASATAPDPCAAIARIAAAARETPPFESLRRAAEDGEAVVPGFLTSDCTIGAAGIFCRDTSFSVDSFQGWPQPLTCPGFVPTGSAQLRSRLGLRNRGEAYFLSDLRIEFGITCSGCAGGSHSYFNVTRRRPEE